MNNNESKMPDLKSLIKTKELQNRQLISDALHDSDGDDFVEKSDITGDLGTQIFSTKFDRSYEITQRHQRHQSGETILRMQSEPETQPYSLNIAGGITMNDLKDPKTRQRILNSLEYRVANRISNASNFKLFENVDLPEEIMEEITQFVNVTLPKTKKTPIFEIVKRGKVERNPAETKQLLEFLQSLAPEFKSMDLDLTIQVMDKITANAFAPNEIILERGKEDDRIVIVIDGEPQLKENGKTSFVKANTLINS